MIQRWLALGGLTIAGWEDELTRWLIPFVKRLGHKTRQRTCPLHVTGLIGPGDRKSAQPMVSEMRCDAAEDRVAQPGGPICRRQGCSAGY